jgi:hypothetical protein
MKTPFRDQVVEEFSSFHVFQDEVAAGGKIPLSVVPNVRGKLFLQVRTSLPDIVKPHNIRMLDKFHDNNLSLDTE